MFESAFRNIDDALRKEAGCTTELDYTEQTSWLLFLKYLDELEQDKAIEAELEGKKYAFILDEPFRWSSWAAPKDKNGKLDHNKAQTGDDLREFVDSKLFPYLREFKTKATSPNTIEYKIGEIFGEIKNKIQSGYTMHDIIDRIDELRFRSQAEKHELSLLYEAKIKNMGNAGRNGGEYYTPRPLILALIKVVQPKVGERIYDGACGSAGFLCEAFKYLRQQPKLTANNLKTLQNRTFYGKEKKSLAYVIAIMNMILHGIEAPNIIHTNTLTENLADIQDKDRMDVILANPPFGVSERREVQQNFPIRTGETAFLFLQHFIKMLKAGGRASVVIKNTFLSNTDSATASLRKLLLESCNLHTVLDCPSGTFQAGVKTVVLFFEKGAPTRKIWFYQLNPGRNLGKTNPLNDADLAEFVKLQKTKPDTDKSWSIDVAAIDTATYDMSVRNPSASEEIIHRNPQEIIDEIAVLDVESAEVVAKIRTLLQFIFTEQSDGWMCSAIGNFCEVIAGQSPKGKYYNVDGIGLPFYQGKKNFGERFIKAPTVWTSKTTKIAHKGDILMSVRAPVGPINFATEDICIGRGLAAIRIKGEIDKDFLFYQLLHLQPKIAGKEGATFASINKSEIAMLPISVPPLREQHHIVAKLNEIREESQRLRAIYQQKLIALNTLDNSLMHQIFSKQI